MLLDILPTQLLIVANPLLGGPAEKAIKCDRLDFAGTRTLDPDIVHGEFLAGMNIPNRNDTGVREVNGGLFLGKDGLRPAECRVHSASATNEVGEFRRIQRDRYVGPWPR